MSVGAVCVTYNRCETVKRCLELLLAQTYPINDILVIDNGSTDGTAEFLANAPAPVRHIRLPTNAGGAGGFAAGLKAAFRAGCDWVWALDDDVELPRDALEGLMKDAEENEWSVVVPRLVPPNSRGGHGSWVQAELFQGGLLKRAVLEECGFPLPEFFIYWDDIEFGLRLRERGIEVGVSDRAAIEHTDWKRMPPKSRRFLWKRISRPIYPDWKAYYLARNQIRMLWLHERRSGAIRAVAGKLAKESAVYLALGERRKAWLTLRGLIDGLLGRMGRRVDPSSPAPNLGSETQDGIAGE